LFSVAFLPFPTQLEIINTNRNEMIDSPLFVTWKKRDKHGDNQLRGCIGTFKAWKLHEGLKHFALERLISRTYRFDC
jgi:AMMECR1 domain-containing protein